MIELQRFVITIIEAMGGIVESIEYGLCSVLVPEEYSYIFGGKTEILLAFDYEVAQENATSEFITFGSYILDCLVELTYFKTISAIRYVSIDSFSLNDPEGKIKKKLNILREQLNIVTSRYITGMWVAFNYKIIYTSDEKSEEYKEIWFNLQTEKKDNKIINNKSLIFYEECGNRTYPVCMNMKIIDAFEESYNEVKNEANTQRIITMNKNELDRDIARINQYYEELKRENIKKTNRKGISQERIAELELKNEYLNTEKEKQLNEIIHKYSIKIDVSLENGIIYLIPLIEYDVEIISRGTVTKKKLYYNPVLKEFDVSDNNLYNNI